MVSSIDPSLQCTEHKWDEWERDVMGQKGERNGWAKNDEMNDVKR
jgi:hypothetical protein